ncbi:MAG: hypothetical protein OFPII_11450 [Osedax symbiont Rs1]|nr:MAG: hypothetical protein OFPII_11450 [Osedax symbiont Rs1]
MARLQLNKSSLAREAANLRTYQKFLPSLDLKRQQLMAEKAKAQSHIVLMEERVSELVRQVRRDLPMLSNREIDLAGLVTLVDYQLVTENVVGTKLPMVENIIIEKKSYSKIAKPHWVDDVARLLQAMLELRLSMQVAKQRLSLLKIATKTITQRVNLFDKVLIPTAAANIKKIKIYLSDDQMAAVVRSKIAKRKRALK